MPDLRGLSAREAVRVLTQLGVAAPHDAAMASSSTQSPAAGERRWRARRRVRARPRTRHRARPRAAEHAVTLGDLLAALREPRAVRRRGSAIAPARGARRHRRRATTRAGSRRARCSSRCAVSTPTAPRSRREAIARGAAADRVRSAARRRCRGVAVDAVDRRAARAGGAGRRRSTAIRASSCARRHHRHQRQDDDRLPARRRSSRRPACAAAARHGRATASAARSAKPRARRRKPRIVQRLLREMVDAGLRRVRDGSVVARAGAEARRRHAVRGRHLHQPDARPPRLPRRHGGRTSRRSAGCSRCCRRDAPGVINLDDPRGAGRCVDAAAAGDLRASTRRPTSRPGRCRSRSPA